MNRPYHSHPAPALMSQMSQVDRQDGLTSDLSKDEAADCLRHIKDAASITWQWVTKAYIGRAWLALGYESWDAMCDGELGGTRLRLPREERREIVGSLREQGMSTRAIGSALGVSKSQVDRDLPTVPNGTVDRVTSLDGRSRPAHVDRTTGVIEDDEVIDAEIVDDPEPERPVAGTARAPRTDVVGVVNTALSRAREAATAAQQITRTHLRDRSEEAAVWGRDLSLSIEVISDLLSRLQEAAQ